MKNLISLFFARNREFYRDKGSLSWSILFPLLLIFGLSFALSGDKYVYKVGVLGDIEEAELMLEPVPWLELIHLEDQAAAEKKLGRQQIDMLIDMGESPAYWVNPSSKKTYFLEEAVKKLEPSLTRHQIDANEVSYVTWVIPGILSMSLMFSCLYGVGYVIVRYRDAGVLKRLMATPVSAAEFLGAQALSRLLISVSTLAVVFIGSYWLLGFSVKGSWLLLLLVAVMGSLSLIALSLLCAARIDSLELMNGVLNLVSWPMILLSGLWFSLDEAPAVVQALSGFMPLTHVVEAARSVMLDGDGLMAIYPHLLALATMTIVFMGLASWSFRWQKS